MANVLVSLGLAYFDVFKLSVLYLPLPCLPCLQKRYASYETVAGSLKFERLPEVDVRSQYEQYSSNQEAKNGDFKTTARIFRQWQRATTKSLISITPIQEK